jgi:hypothetical protein
MTSRGGRLTPDVTRVSVPKPVPLDVATSTHNTRRSTMSDSTGFSGKMQVIDIVEVIL